MYFGSDETSPAGGRRADRHGGRQEPLCVIQAGRLGRAGGPVRRREEEVPRDREHPGQRRRRRGGDLVAAGQAAQDKTIDYIVTLGAPIALDALKAMERPGSSAKLVTFDLNADAAKAIKDGKIEFSIDQQPYVQGYLAVESLYLYMKNGNDIGGGGGAHRPVVRRLHNIDTILPFAKNNTR